MRRSRPRGRACLRERSPSVGGRTGGRAWSPAPVPPRRSGSGEGRRRRATRSSATGRPALHPRPRARVPRSSSTRGGLLVLLLPRGDRKGLARRAPQAEDRRALLVGDRGPDRGRIRHVDEGAFGRLDGLAVDRERREALGDVVELFVLRTAVHELVVLPDDLAGRG